jgi:peptidyl-prolyl cis-trans isomerase D
MLLRIRDVMQGHKWLAWVVLGAIGATFIFWGGSNSLDFSGPSKSDAAEVNGEEIPASKATQAWAQTQNRWSQQFGTEIPAEQRAKIQDNILDNLILQKLVELRLDDEQYRVSESKVLADIQNIPAFKGIDGKYDANQARSVLRSNNMTEHELVRQTRTQLLTDQLQQGIGGSYFLTRAEAQRLYNLENEEREVQYVGFTPDNFAGAEPIAEGEIQTYYAKNGDRFMTTESVALEYAELRLEQLATQVIPTEDDLKKLYEDNRASYVLEERRRMRLIVIALNPDDDAAAQKKAESVLAEARAGKDFAELAKKYSVDPSATVGGEIDFVEKTAFVGPIGDTLFAMKLGDIAGPVKSQYGYYILKLEGIQPAESKPYESVHAELDSQYRADRAAALFGDRQDEINAALEKGQTDIDKLAKDLGLTRGSIAEFLRGGGADPLGSSVDLQQAVFSDPTLNQGKIGGPVALGDDRMVLVKVTAHHKAEVKALPLVRDQIVALLRHERGTKAAKAAADAALAKLTAGEKIEALASASNAPIEPARFVNRSDPSFPAALRTAIFEAPRPGASPVVKSATIDDGSTVVFIVTRTRVSDTSANPQLAQQVNQQLLQRSAAGDVAAYVNEAKRKAKIVKNPAVFE